MSTTLSKVRGRGLDASILTSGTLGTGRGGTGLTHDDWLAKGPTYIMFLDGATYRVHRGATGAEVSSGADPGAIIQACITDAGTSPFTLVLHPGTYTYTSTVPAFNKDATGWQVIYGLGATIKLASGAPRAFDFNRTADYDTFQNIWLEGFTVDCNNVGGQHHVVLGTYISGVRQRRLNFQDIVIRDVRTINVPVDPTIVNHRLNVLIVGYHLGASETATYCKNVWVEGCDFRGGNAGVVITAEGIDAVGLTHFLDNIHIHRCKHSLLSAQSSVFSSANFFIGNRAYGGHAHISDCYGEYSGDVGVEVNNVNALVENVVIKDAYSADFFHTNYNNLLSADEQLVTFRNCAGRRISLAATTLAKAFHCGSSFSTGLGSVVLENCKSYSEGTSASHKALSFQPTAGFQRLDVRGFKANDQSMSVTAGDYYYRTVEIAPSGGSKRGSVSVRNVGITVAGSKTGGTLDLVPIVLAGTMDLDMDDVALDVDVTGVSGVKGIGVGYDTVASIAGIIRNYRIKQITSDASPKGICIGGTEYLTIPTELRIEDSDFSALAAGVDILFNSTSNSGKVFLLGNVWKGFSASHFADGPEIAGIAGESLVYGDFCYRKSDGKWWKSDADQASTMPLAAMVVSDAITADAEGVFLLSGVAHDDSWSWTVGGTLYASTTTGALTQTVPSGTGDQIQVVGIAKLAAEILLNPSYALDEVT